MSQDMFGGEALSKTAKYKKITKPLLERKRRARINRCLDELKELMVGALEIDDDNMSKLEKADILELTVNHLTKLHSPQDPVVEAKKFQAGFGQCAAEACRFILSIPDLDSKVSENLIGHLSRLVATQPLTIQVPERQFSPPISPPSPISEKRGYYSDQDRSMSDGDDNSAYDNMSQHSANAWHQRQVPVAPVFRNAASKKQLSTPLSGLLTTIDKVGAQKNYKEFSYKHKSDGYFNKVPAEAKDAILQKIRQHIMEKRGNDVHASTIDVNMQREYSHSQYRYAYENEERLNYQYMQHEPHDYVPNHYVDTLDLRKTRLPKTSPIKYDDHVAYEHVKERVMLPMISPISSSVSENSIENKPQKLNPETVNIDESDLASDYKRLENPVEVKSIVPEHCELPVDYSNLPPKKKRKLIEYQEFKKQEELRRLAEKNCQYANGVGDDGSAWRPW